MFGSRLPAIWTTLLTVSLLACVACEKKPHDLAFHVSFVCPEDQAATDTLTLHVIKGGCDGSEWVYEASLGPDEIAPVGKGIDPGSYGFEAIATAEGNEVAAGCVESTLPSSETPTIALRSDTCTETPSEDAGEDASASEDAEAPDMDADTLDAESDAQHDAESDAQLDAEADAEMDADTGDASAGDSGMSTVDADAMAPDANVPDAAPIPCTTDCKDSFPCTDDRCVNGECVHEPYTGTRECDGITCTVSDRCESGNCAAGTPNHGACPDDGNPCTAETCVPGVGCNRQNAANTTSCNDQIGCTSPDRCNNGICRGADTCTNGAVCSASSGMCISCTRNADCNDSDPCTTDTCNTSMGRCNNTRDIGKLGVCTDNKSCTSDDACTATGCAGTSTCPTNASCGGSSCICNDSNQAWCEDKSTTPSSFACATLSSDPKFCGSCERSCASGASCQNSACKPSGAETDCTAYRNDGHDYLICNNALTWAAARDRCRSWGFGLVIIESDTENAFLTERIDSAPRWIGANDRGNNGRGEWDFLGGKNGDRACTLYEEEGTWYWARPSRSMNSQEQDDNYLRFCVMQNDTSSTCNPVDNRYTRWKTNEPNNDPCRCNVGNNCDEGEDCGVLLADGYWNDDKCSATTLGYICESP